MMILDDMRRFAGQKVDMKICMMGPRAVGKTTILTAIFNETQESIASTKLILNPKGDTNIEVINRKRMLSSIFAKRQEIADRPDAGISATSAVHTFQFDFGMKGKKPRIELEVKDFPGEYIKNNPEDVISFIDESNAIMIAIDSPHLMELDGEYGEAKNNINEITSFFKRSLSTIESGKLVLLVPLKCEKYFFNDQMDTLLSKVESAYSELISLCKSSENIACAITPILTLGGVEFDKFEMPNGMIQLTSDNTPKSVLYKFRGDDAKYAPAFCIQPLYYMLSYISAEYIRNKNSLSFLNRCLSMFFKLFESDPELFDEILKMEQYRKVSGNGYAVISGKNKFHYNR